MLSVYKVVATAAFATMVFGLLQRHRNPRLHARLMGTAILVDWGIVLLLELQRKAVETAISAELGWMQMTHIASSTVAALLYLPVALLGWRRLRGRAGPTACKAHLVLGAITFTARAIGFVFMWSVESR